MSPENKSQVTTRIHFESVQRTQTIDKILRTFQTLIADNVGFMKWEYENLDEYFWFPEGIEVRGIYAFIAAYTYDREKYLRSINEHFNGLDIRIKKTSCAGYKPLAIQHATQHVVR